MKISRIESEEDRVYAGGFAITSTKILDSIATILGFKKNKENITINKRIGANLT